MSTPIIVTLIICGTVLLAVIAGLLFAMWVINKGVAVSQMNKK